MPSDTLALDRRRVVGIAADAGSRTSHTAILARSLGIPAVLGLSDVSRHARQGEGICIDGNRGVVVIEPDPDTRARFARRKAAWEEATARLAGLNDLPAETLDGKLVRLEANIEVPDEVDAVLSHGADGIGLFRSEFLFLQPGRFPSEDEQERAYGAVLRAMGERPVTIRTLDLGGRQDRRRLRPRRRGEPHPRLAGHPLLPRPARGVPHPAAGPPARLGAREPPPHVPAHLGARRARADPRDAGRGEGRRSSATACRSAATCRSGS